MSSNVPATAQDDIITVGEAPQIEATLMDKAFGTGDLKALQPRERVNMYLALCESIGLNPLSRPFEYISMKGNLVLYFKATGAEQLRVIHGVNVTIAKREMLDGMYIVTATATLPSGRTDEAQGIVCMEGLKRTDKANAMMKCETKAKRRVTLSILGMSFLEDVYAKPKDTGTAVAVHVDQATGEITNQASIDAQQKRDNAVPASMINRRLSKTMASTPAPPPEDEPKAIEQGWASWSDAAQKRFWAKADELNLSGDGIHHEFGVESMKDYAGTMSAANSILDILDYGINKRAIGLQGIWEALDVGAVCEWEGHPQMAATAIDKYAGEQAAKGEPVKSQQAML